MRKYDIILFENYHLASHHKYDVVLIARLLKYSGYKVAILDIYGEENVDEIEGIPIEHLQSIGTIPNDKWNKAPKNKIHSLYATIRFLWQQYLYMRKVVKKVQDRADMFYCGSYHLLMPSAFMKLHKPCFYWGLRSHRMSCFGKHFRRNPLLAFRMLYLKNRFIKNPYQKLFVSNEIIKNEFIQLGINENRLVIREERCIEETSNCNKEKLDSKCTFLTIGMLRPDKQIDKTISAYQKAQIENSRLLLVGRSSSPQYEDIISKSSANNNKIDRVNKFLEYDDFNSYIACAHYVVFADRKQASSVTNGTMLEALINHRPIIAPNYDPYAYYIKKYNIGILYEPDDKESFKEAFIKAEKVGCESFFPSINAFLHTISFEKVSKDLSEALKR